MTPPLSLTFLYPLTRFSTDSLSTELARGAKELNSQEPTGKYRL